MNEHTERLLSQPACTVADFARLMGLSLNAAYEAVNRGDVKAIRFGRRIIIPTIYVREMLGFEEIERRRGAA